MSIEQIIRLEQENSHPERPNREIADRAEFHDCEQISPMFSDIPVYKYGRGTKNV
jgi:hypothetical protein